MKIYTLAHAAYFEACIAGHPREFCQWLADNIPPLEPMQKNSLEWLMLRSIAMPEYLPDYCYGCHWRNKDLPGGRIRLVCPGCIKEDKPEADSQMNWFLDMQIRLLEKPGYFSELLEYLLAVHALWIATEKHKLDEIRWGTTASPVSVSSIDRLREQLRTNSYDSKSGN